ncbi:response regulator transcription factor [Marinobacterium sediminicola]|uniref:Two component transcriptional regulator, winged helix family n=1 Tax=Marinobacterium sediminicola TaxID=518898 RepID=A0ABY1RXG4_9GAMM|nr:response regulator transcription factor [Marinobacterium sediminicola]ULG67802.1 response regulator transcription factor [Marinobacterium sediminicola]SMR71522.1 two component transcriptional regulator, winged helix family [Marinobacterium sediminicola]
MRLLLVEDDAELVDRLKAFLNKAGYVVETASDGVDGQFLGLEESFDAVILDLGLPKKSGMDVLKSWRKTGRDMPVLVLTARDAWHERVDGLKAGADDYLGKPFHPEELLARLEALVRRNHGHASSQLEVAGIQLDISRQIVADAQGRKHQLTGTEFRLLRYMMLNADRILSKTELSEHVYEEEHLRDSNVIEVYINRLRQLLGKEVILTRRGQGYCLPSSSGQVI